MDSTFLGFGEMGAIGMFRHSGLESFLNFTTPSASGVLRGDVGGRI